LFRLNIKIRPFLFFLFGTHFLFTPANASEPVEIKNFQIALEDFQVYYAHESKQSLSIEQAKKLNFKPIKNRNSFAIEHKITWYKLELKNSSDVLKNFYLHNNLAYMSQQIDIYEFEDDHQTDQHNYKILNSDIAPKFNGSTLIYPISLNGQSKKTLYIKNQALIHQLLDLSLFDEHASKQALINKNFYSNIVIVILFSLAFYNGFLFFYSKRKEFIFYALYLFNAALGLFYMYGSVFNHLNIYGKNAYWFNLTAILVTFFLALFVKSIFETQTAAKKINLLLNLLVLVSLTNALIAIVYDLTFAMQIVQYTFFFSFFVLLYTGVYFYKKNHPLARIFLLAYTTYIITFLITVLMIIGIIPYSDFSFHSSGYGLVIEAFLFSYLLHFRIRLLEDEINKHKNLLILKQKKSQMGDMIGAISHQWKQPLTAIGSITTLLQYRLQDEAPISTRELKGKLLQINEKIDFLNETLNDFRYFFNPRQDKQACDIGKIIDQAVALSHEDMMSEDIILKTDYRFSHTMALYQNELLHIILNLIQNAREAFRNKRNRFELNQTNEQEPGNMIKIIGKTESYGISIDIIDNAGGIAEENLDYIFDEFYSTKDNTQGSGLGLYLSRFILEKHMHGSIEVHNTIHDRNINRGTVFRIKIRSDNE